MTGNAGCGKSFLMKVIYQAITKTLSYKDPTLDKPKILILAPTEAAALNVDGTTIHSALQMLVGNFGKKFPQVRDKMKPNLRKKLYEVN